MPLIIYTCTKGHEFASRKDPKSNKVKDKPQCSICGERIKSTELT